MNGAKNIVIVGGSSGIGLAAAESLKGNNIVNISRSACPLGYVRNITADVQSTEEIRNAVRGSFEKIDALIYSAGFSFVAPVEYAEADDYKKLFDINFFGFVECVKNAIPRMSGGGRIIAVSSVGGVSPITFDSFYSASKAALNMFCRALDNELKQYGIRVTAFLPGGTKTQFTFKRLVYDYGSVGRYAKRLSCSSNSLAKIEQTGMDVIKVGKILSTYALGRKGKIRAAGVVNTLLCVLNKLLPLCVSDFIASKLYC